MHFYAIAITNILKVKLILCWQHGLPSKHCFKKRLSLTNCMHLTVLTIIIRTAFTTSLLTTGILTFITLLM